jgi:hypothetical protein
MFCGMRPLKGVFGTCWFVSRFPWHPFIHFVALAALRAHLHQNPSPFAVTLILSKYMSAVM